MSKIGIAIIGSGIFAKEQHLPAVLAAENLDLKAVYSRTLNSAATLCEGLAHSVDFYSDETKDEKKGFEDLLANENIKAVIIALPIPNQPEFIKKALQAGKHVLAEKPIGPDVETAKELVEWYHKEIDTSKVTWAVAENFRFFDTFLQAQEEVKKLGKLLGFRMRACNMTNPGGKYFETPWRKEPKHQGGFVLDGGIHSIAALRLMLSGAGDDIVRVSCFTNQLQEHLPPLDTVNATCKTTSGISGTVAISFGTTFKGSGYSIACEKGVVTVVGTDVTIEKNGLEEKKSFPDQGFGVMQEVKAWGEALAAGKPNPMQSPEEGLKDLQVLEAMFKSGEQDGAPLDTGVSK